VSKALKSKGTHPSVDKRFRPRTEKLDSVREALEPFGLSKNDDKTWSTTLAPIFLALAHHYNFRRDSGSVPRPGHVIRSLTEVEKASDGLKKAAGAFVEAIGALDDVALEYMLAFDDPHPLFARSRAETAGPSGASDTLKRLRDKIFGPEFKEYDRLAARRFRESDSGMQTAIKERDQAAKDLLDARSEFEQLNRLWPQHIRKFVAGSAERKKIDQQISDSLRTLEEKERAFRMSTLCVGAFTPPAPHFFRDNLKVRISANLDEALRRVAPIAVLAGQSRERFVAASPIDKGGFSPLFLGKPPKYRLAKECCEVIFYAFGAHGFDRIQSTKEGNFANLLRAVHEFATGEEASGDEFREALDRIDELRSHLGGAVSRPVPRQRRPRKKPKSLKPN
jgi:hypothetical protein